MAISHPPPRGGSRITRAQVVCVTNSGFAIIFFKSFFLILPRFIERILLPIRNLVCDEIYCLQLSHPKQNLARDGS
jgi:hypothetical protein